MSSAGPFSTNPHAIPFLLIHTLPIRKFLRFLSPLIANPQILTIVLSLQEDLVRKSQSANCKKILSPQIENPQVATFAEGLLTKKIWEAFNFVDSRFAEFICGPLLFSVFPYMSKNLNFLLPPRPLQVHTFIYPTTPLPTTISNSIRVFPIALITPSLCLRHMVSPR